MALENDQANLQEAVAGSFIGGADTSAEQHSPKQDTKQRPGRKCKSRSNLQDYPASSRKKRKSDEVSNESEVESDTAEVVTEVSAHESKPSAVKQKMSTKEISKITAQGSPASSARSHTFSEPPPDPTPLRRKDISPTSSHTYHGPLPHVIFSSTTTFDGKKNVMESFRSLGGSVTKAMKTANILCVSSGPLEKTPKFVIAFGLGKGIVTEQWLVQCHRENKLLDHTSFMPQDEEHEREWRFDLRTAIDKGKQGMSDLLESVKIHFT